MVGIDVAVLSGAFLIWASYTFGYRRGTQTSAQATMIIIREFLVTRQGEDWTNMTLGKNFNRLARWMDNLEDETPEGQD